jgi:hypothetical protein
MARRGEGQFVAIETNLVNDPKLKGIARALKIHVAQAIGHVALWRALVLTRATGTGLLKGYSAPQVAEALEWPGRPGRIIDALVDAGYLKRRRGGAYTHPEWADTVTGGYAHRRQAQREYDRQRGRDRGADGAAGGEEGAPPPGGDPSGIPSGSDRDPSGSRNGSGHQSTNGPPGPPGAGGESQPSAPSGWWEWFRELHPKMRNPTKCRRLLGKLGREDLDQLWYCLPIHAPLYRDKEKKKAWRFVPFADSYLEDGTFWEYRRPKPKVPKETNGEAEAQALAAKLDDDAKTERNRELLQQRAIVIERMRSEGIAIRRGQADFEELVEQRLEAGEGRPS